MKKYMNETQACYETDLSNSLKTWRVKSDYFGQANRAIDGEICRPWENRKLIAMFPKELAGGHNYCRTIDGSAGLITWPGATAEEIRSLGKAPWCYTKNGPTQCAVESCSAMKTLMGNNMMTILIACGSSILVFLLTCVICCFVRWQNAKSKNKKEAEISKQNALVQQSLISNNGKLNPSHLGIMDGSQINPGSFLAAQQASNFGRLPTQLDNRLVEGAYSSRSFSSGNQMQQQIQQQQQNQQNTAGPHNETFKTNNS